MLARCLIQPLRTSSLLLNRPPTKALLAVRDSFKSQLIKDRKFSVSARNANKPNNYERLRERQNQTKSNFNVQSLQEFEQELSELGLVMKFKKIVSEYYHVIIGVHLVTSCFWFSTTFLIKYQL